MPTYQIDTQHAGAHFKVRHMMISNVKGEFSHITGSVEFDPANLATAQVQASMDAATVSTREPQRDSHLKSRDFLDVNRYPTITFQSTKVVPAGEHGYDVTGDLTIRGVTRSVTLHVESLTPEIKDPDGFLQARRQRQHADRTQRLRTHLECGTRKRRIPGGRRRRYHHRRRAGAQRAIEFG